MLAIIWVNAMHVQVISVASYSYLVTPDRDLDVLQCVPIGRVSLFTGLD